MLISLKYWLRHKRHTNTYTRHEHSHTDKRTRILVTHTHTLPHRHTHTSNTDIRFVCPRERQYLRLLNPKSTNVNKNCQNSQEFQSKFDVREVITERENDDEPLGHN